MDTVSHELSQLATQIKLRPNAVPGEGNPHAEIVFIGEAPGKKEEESGIPFCGASGKILNSLLESISLSREDVFITNVVNYRPPGNRDPLPSEIAFCTSNYLNKQLNLINPKLIVTLGRHALGHFIQNKKISEVHGQPQQYKGQTYLPLYHPAATLYNRSLRKILEEDFQKIPHLLQ